MVERVADITLLRNTGPAEGTARRILCNRQGMA